uniref:hypothetical protein n=1 Tax=Ralstonia insidiosa TaxID=190721 RepID=UPI001427D666
MLTADQIQKIWESLEWKDLDVLNPTFNKTLNLRFARAVEAEVLRVQADAGSEILARVWYHPRPEENDYDVHDSSNFSSPPDCEKCIEALIVRGSHTHPSLPAVQGLSDDEIVGIWERVVGGPGAKPDGIDFARAI